MPDTDIDLIQQLRTVVSATTAKERSSAKLFHNAIEHALKRKGWKTVREFPVDNRGDGVAGRIDLVVTSPVSIGIELDHASTRKKSLYKLSRFKGAGVVVLRKTCQLLLVRHISKG
jgi:hypothetical protein